MVLDDLGVLVGVDATAQAEVEDRGDGAVGVAVDLVELVDVDGADALDRATPVPVRSASSVRWTKSRPRLRSLDRREAGSAQNLARVSVVWSGARAGRSFGSLSVCSRSSLRGEAMLSLSNTCSKDKGWQRVCAKDPGVPFGRGGLSAEVTEPAMRRERTLPDPGPEPILLRWVAATT